MFNEFKLPEELSERILDFLQKQKFDFTDFGELIGDFPFQSEIEKNILNEGFIKTQQIETGVFSDIKFEVFQTKKKNGLFKHSDSRNGYCLKLVIWFVPSDFLPEDGGELIFSMVSQQEIEMLGGSFNAERYYDFSTACEIQRYQPTNGLGVCWDNQDFELLHEVSIMQTDKKRYSVTVCLGYSKEVNDIC